MFQKILNILFAILELFRKPPAVEEKAKAESKLHKEAKKIDNLIEAKREHQKANYEKLSPEEKRKSDLEQFDKP